MVNDFYELDPAAPTWVNLTFDGAPSPRAGHGLAAAGSKLFVFGGYEGLWLLGARRRALPARMPRWAAGLLSIAMLGQRELWSGVAQQ